MSLLTTSLCSSAALFASLDAHKMDLHINHIIDVEIYCQQVLQNFRIDTADSNQSLSLYIVNGQREYDGTVHFAT